MSITAAGILRQLDAHWLGAQMAALAALDTAHQAEVRRELRAVRPSARIDLGVLVESVKAQVQARAEADAERLAKSAPMMALRYRLSLLSEGRLKELRAHLREAEARGEVSVDFGPGSVAAAILERLDTIAERLYTADDVQPDAEPDDEAPPKRRRGVPRRRLSRPVVAAEAEPAPAEAQLPARRQPPVGGRRKREAERSTFLGPRLLGPGDPDRPFGAPIDYDRSAWSPRPPWLLSEDDGDDEPDEEIEDVDC